jgi:carboxyl-terminal processing protease
MKLKRTIVGPILIVLTAVISGGWLLQRGVSGAGEGAGLLDEVMRRVSRSYVDARSSEELHRMAVEGLLHELGDPHTTFMTAEDYAELRMSTTGEYGGLGIQISERDGWITVLSPLPGTPAERAGIIAGDRIISVEGESTEGWTDDDAVQVLRGPKGAPVTIGIARVGVNEPIEFTIVRDEIHINSVRTAYMIEPGIGYADLDVFSETSTQELTSAIEELRGQGMRAMVLDLRTNPGGLLDQGVSVSDLFLDAGQAIVETRGREPRENVTFQATRGEVVDGFPIVVLVDQFSASAAEIVAGALQDHDRALVIGTPTYGKGSVQTLFPLSGGNFLKMTTGKWYTPVGRSIERDREREGDPVALLEDEPIAEDGTPAPAAESVDTAGRSIYRTDSGRIVYGGGGIVPDLIVTPDTLTEAEQEFLQAAAKAGSTYQDVVYGYALEYVRSTPGLDRDFRVTPAMRDEFFGSIVESGLEVSREQFDNATRVVDRRLAYEIAMAAWGLSVASQVATNADNVVAAAVDLLRSAASQQALFQSAEAGKTAAGS